MHKIGMVDEGIRQREVYCVQLVRIQPSGKQGAEMGRKYLRAPMQGSAHQSRCYTESR